MSLGETLDSQSPPLGVLTTDSEKIQAPASAIFRVLGNHMNNNTSRKNNNTTTILLGKPCKTNNKKCSTGAYLANGWRGENFY